MSNFPQNEIANLSRALSQSQALQTHMRNAINDFLDAWSVVVIDRKIEITLPEVLGELPQTYIFHFDDEQGDEWSDRGQALLALVKTVTNIEDEYPDVDGSIDIEEDFLP